MDEFFPQLRTTRSSKNSLPVRKPSGGAPLVVDAGGSGLDRRFNGGCLHCVENSTLPRELTQVDTTHKHFSVHSLSGASQEKTLGSPFTQGGCSTRTLLSSMSKVGRSILAPSLQIPNNRLPDTGISNQNNSYPQRDLLNRTPLANISNVNPHANPDRFGTFLSKKACSLGYTEMNVTILQQTVKAKHKPVGRADKIVENGGNFRENNSYPQSDMLDPTPLASISNVIPHANPDRFGTFLSKKAGSLGYTEGNVTKPNQKSKAKHHPVVRAVENLENGAVFMEKGYFPENSTLADVLLAMKKENMLRTNSPTEPSTNTCGAGDVQHSSCVADGNCPLRKKPVSRITSYNDVQHCSINIDMDADQMLTARIGDFDEEGSAIRGFMILKTISWETMITVATRMTNSVSCFRELPNNGCKLHNSLRTTPTLFSQVFGIDMPSWWAKSSSKDANKKSNKGSLINSIHQKFRIVTKGKSNSGSGGSAKQHCDTKLASRPPISPSSRVSRCESFAERPQALPLPLPGPQHNTKHHDDSGNVEAAAAEISEGSKSFMFFPLPKPPHGPNPVDAGEAAGTASVSSDKSMDTDNTSDSYLRSPQASGHKNGKEAATNSPSSVIKKNQSPKSVQKSPREKLNPTNTILNNQVPTSLKPSRASSHTPNSQIPQHSAFFIAPDSKISSPSRSPVRLCGPERVMNSGGCVGKPCADLPMLGPVHCSSPGLGHNSVGGNLASASQLLWQYSRCSPECSPIPSPRMTSPGPSSIIHSGAVTPLHPRKGKAIELPAHWPAGKHEGHKLPLPPIMISNTYPSYSTETTPVTRSPSRAENPTRHGPRWKKGQLLGQGTFGHVYVGFDSENGEMCAIKEVTLISDDPKSEESAQQLWQEIELLSHLRHPNIVKYLGSEVADDKLYIYMEYVSGGSIYKILRNFGRLGEAAIRSFTYQILSGLAYLHARHTVHRDIKGANILVDPNGGVKLADFGMAKHISGQPCHLSFKGSPYWMAPEIIRNSSDCNVAVDVWSLGCTIVEMATKNPPWSQLEPAAAIFKIGYSEELPDMPQNLSDHCKDFIKRCLQRDPSDRPSAAQLLEHPFVKNFAPPVRSVPCLEPLETMHLVKGYGHARNVSYLDKKGAAIKHSRVPNIFSGSSDAYVPWNIPPAVPQTTSSLLHPLSPRGLSPRTCASPHIISSSSTPLIGGGGAIPLHLSKQPPMDLHEGMGINPRFQKSVSSKNRMSNEDLQPELFQGTSEAYHIYQKAVQSRKVFPSSGR